jgi:hypothetical protein
VYETDQSVIIHFFNYGREELDDLFQLEAILRVVVDKAGIGQYDGHEIAIDGSDGFLFMYGPDADTLYSAVKPILQKIDYMKGAEVRKQYGSVYRDAPELVFTMETENN